MLLDVVKHIDAILETDKIKDYPGSQNGLQVANNGIITKIGTAVDCDLQTIEEAVKNKVDFLIVHHGLFWNPSRQVTNIGYKKMKLLMDNNIAVYSSHLPLDFHETLGNNMLLAKEIFNKYDTDKFKNLAPAIPMVIVESGYFPYAYEIEKILNRVVLTAYGKHRISGSNMKHKIGICTGNGGSVLDKAIELGCDLFITGELAQHNHSVAYEHDITIMSCGHYATETFGVEALAKYLTNEIKLPIHNIRVKCEL